MRRVAKGFTILELLVVVGIIAILISFLFPAVTRVRAHAHLAGCMSNQNQIYTALKEFAQNNEKFTQSVMPAGNPNLGLGKADICPGSSGQLKMGLLPQVSSGGPNANGIGQAIATGDTVSQETVDGLQRSALIVRRYLPNSSIFHCPERDSHPACYNGIVWSPTMYHYAFNVHFVGTHWADPDLLPGYSGGLYAGLYPNSPTNLLPVTLNRAKDPAGCVLITEDGRGNDGAQRDYVLEIPPQRMQSSPVHSRRTPKATDALPFTAADYAVCTFVDGHTEPILVNTTLNDPNAFTVPTNNDGLR